MSENNLLPPINRRAIVISVLLIFVTWYTTWYTYGTKITTYTVDSKLQEYNYRLHSSDPHPISLIDDQGNLSTRNISVSRHARTKAGERLAFTDELRILHHQSWSALLLNLASMLAVLYLVSCISVYFTRKSN